MAADAAEQARLNAQSLDKQMTDADSTAALRPFQDFMRVWIWPEVTRRRERGEVRAPFELYAAQVVFYPYHRSHDVRLNEEVEIRGRVLDGDGKPIPTGQSIAIRDIVDLEWFELGPGDDPDAGHITAIRTSKGWLFGFDARYNKGLSRRHLAAAREYLEAARFSMQQAHWRACIDNLFSAMELAAKAQLLTVPDKKLRSRLHHKELKNRYREWYRLGNASADEHSALATLGSWRSKARYLDGDLPKDIATDVERFIATVSEAIEREQRGVSNDGG